MFSTTRQPTVESKRPVFYKLLPYDQRTIITPLDEATVRAQVAAHIAQLNSAPLPKLFSYGVRFEGSVAGDSFVLSGPIGNRRFRLETRGTIWPALDGTAVELTLRLSAIHQMAVIFQFVMIWIWALLVGFPLIMVLFLSGFLYVVTVLSFRFEAARLVRQLGFAVGPQPEPSERSVIVPDSIGWRCGACGGYIREDASFCKHCKQRFKS